MIEGERRALVVVTEKGGYRYVTLIKLDTKFVFHGK
jgi:hypothetical protein